MNTTDATPREIESLFKADALGEYDFSDAPRVVRLRGGPHVEALGKKRSISGRKRRR